MDTNNDRLSYYITSYNREVTGSNTLVTICYGQSKKFNILLDCGLDQDAEDNEYDFSKFPYNPENIDAVIVSHVHTDHLGRCPLLVKRGLQSPIYTSRITEDLAGIMLNDSAEINYQKYTWAIKKWQKQRKETVNAARKKQRYCDKKPKLDAPTPKPVLLYSKDDVKKCLAKLYGQDVGRTISPTEGLEITFYPNGHLHGAFLTVCRAWYKSEEFYLLFTGDLALVNQVTDVETSLPKEIAEKINCIICESTYGSAPKQRDRKSDVEKQVESIKHIYKEGGTIYYIVNALERPQVIFRQLKELSEGILKDEMKNIPIYFDSTLGIKLHEKYLRTIGDNHLPKKLKLVTKDDRDSIIGNKKPQIVLCTSPLFYMGSFANYIAKGVLSNPKNIVIIPSYVKDRVQEIIQLPKGSIINYNKTKVIKRCSIIQLRSYSCHANIEEMEEFLNWFPNTNTLLFNHGSHDAKESLVEYFGKNGLITKGMDYGETFRLDCDGLNKIY